MCGNYLALALGKFPLVGCIISDFCSYSKKVMEVMVLAQKNPAKFRIFYQVFLNTK
jgi:hypothetical protein